MSEPTEKSLDGESVRLSAVGPTPAAAHLVLPPIPPAPPSPSTPFPTRIGEFEILGKLGEGAFGQVFLARQVSLGREVALKVERVNEDDLPPGSFVPSGSSETAARNEGQLLASLEHDHIVKVFSEFRDPATGSRGLCLQYVPGADLGAVIKRVHPGGTPPQPPPRSGSAILAALDATRRGEAGFDPASLRDRDSLAGDDFGQAVCRLGARLAEALAFAHARGVLHCDIKPGNILLTPYGRPMLADFNVAFDVSRHQASGGGIGGTLAYMAPEHRAAVMGLVWGSVDERCDVFSLGVVLYELATGKRPAIPKPGVTVVEPEVSPLDQLPRELAAVIRRCLEAEATERYQTAGELAEALNSAWQLLAARRALPAPGRIGRWVNANTLAALVFAAALPHLIASAVNISYNMVEIKLDKDLPEHQRPGPQQRAFNFLLFAYNVIAYPLCLGTAAFLFLRIRRGLAGLPRARGPAVDDLRWRVRQLGWWTIALGAVGWFPGGVVFPLVIDLTAGGVSPAMYAHYMVSFTLAGLIGVVFTYLAIEYAIFRALLPRLGNPDAFTPAKMWDEVRPLTTPFGAFLVLACAVPLVGATLLILLANDSLGFRVLVAALIGIGVAGVGVAERLTRKLRTLAAVWQRDAREAA